MHLRWSRFKGTTLSRALLIRYTAVVAILLVLIGVIQVQSLERALVVAGQSNLSFALRDALDEPSIGKQLQTMPFSKVAPKLLYTLNVRGINVRLYDKDLRNLGEQSSKYDPVHLMNITKKDVLAVLTNTGSKSLESTAFGSDANMVVREDHGQILLFAAVFVNNAVVGYVELGYLSSLFYPIISGQIVLFLGISILVLLLAAALLFPVVRAPLKPLNYFMQTAERIRKGAFQERFPMMGPRDMERLAEVMNEALDQLARAVEQEQKSTTRMKQFVSAASHELRTPLTAIRGFTEVLLRRVASYEEEIQLFQVDVNDEDDEFDGDFSPAKIYSGQLSSVRLALNTMEQETMRLESLVRDLLQLARLDEGLQPKIKQEDLAVLVDSMHSQLDVLSCGQEMRYVLDYAPVKCDRSMVQQIIYNLAMNAIQYTPSESGVITITTGECRRGSATAFLSVNDTGSGISEKQKKHIFDRFYRASEARERNPGGAGLGLAIVAEIVRAHGGYIDVQSTVGQGTTMTVYL